MTVYLLATETPGRYLLGERYGAAHALETEDGSVTLENVSELIIVDAQLQFTPITLCSRMRFELASYHGLGVLAGEVLARYTEWQQLRKLAVAEVEE